MFLKFTHIVAWISSLLLFILLLSRIPIYKYITISLSICLLMDIWVLSCFLAVMNRLLSLYKSFGGLKFSIHLGKCLGMEMLVNNTDVRSLYKKLTKSSPKILFHFIPPTSNVWKFQLLYILSNTWYCQSFWFCHLLGTKCYLRGFNWQLSWWKQGL